MPAARVDLATESVNDDLLILDKTAGMLHKLNHSASIVWLGITDGLNSQKIASRIVESFDVSVDQALWDVEDIISQFESLNLLEPNNN